MTTKPDGNQAAIVSSLRAAGASVTVTSMVGGGFVDLVVGFRAIPTWSNAKIPTVEVETPSHQLRWNGSRHGRVGQLRWLIRPRKQCE